MTGFIEQDDDLREFHNAYFDVYYLFQKLGFESSVCGKIHGLCKIIH
jgi:hypothetical protein